MTFPSSECAICDSPATKTTKEAYFRGLAYCELHAPDGAEPLPEPEGKSGGFEFRWADEPPFEGDFFGPRRRRRDEPRLEHDRPGLRRELAALTPSETP